MTRPRRAFSEESDNRNMGTIAPIVVVTAAAVLLVAGVIGVVVWQFRPAGSNAAAAAGSTGAPTPQRDPVRTGARIQLQSCADQVAAGDRVLDAADSGIADWSAHVQAQTDANNGRISPAERDAIFDRTVRDGPADLEAFDRAVDARSQLSAACRQMPEAPQQLEQLINQCVSRLDVQEEALRHGTAAMNDWRHHLIQAHGDRASESQEGWIRDWSAAPNNIDGWQQAMADYKVANSCTG